MRRRQFVGLLGAGTGATVGLSATASAQETPVVSMASNEFDPVGLHVEPSTTVRFSLDDGSHSATAYADRIPTEATPFDSGVISSGGFEHTFDVAGTYDYYCIPHESMGMVGRIVVGEPGGPAEGSPIPEGSVPDSETIVEEGTVAAGGESGGNRHGGGMGRGMMDGGPWWMMLMPLGFLSVVLASVGGVAYWAARRGSNAGGGDSAMASLREEYARGDVDDEEFERRREQLEGSE